MQGPNTNQRKINRGGLTHVPSPRWHGAVIVSLMVLGFAIILSYAALDWDWQQSWGSKNYWAAGIVWFIFSVTLRYWKNDPRRLFNVNDKLDGAAEDRYQEARHRAAHHRVS